MLEQSVERFGWGLLAILWGATILLDFVPFSIGLLGTGLIMLGVNIFLRLNRLPAANSNIIWGSLILAWGALEFGRPWLRQLFPSADLDWAIFAILLIGWGLISLIRALQSARGTPFGTFSPPRAGRE